MAAQTGKFKLLHCSTMLHGFTLTELAIVLGIIGLILGAIWTAASKVYANNRVNKAATEVLSVANGVRATFSSKGVLPSGYLTQAGINFGWFPSDMIQNIPGSYDGLNPSAVSPWGSEMLVGSQIGWGQSPPASNRFEVIYASGSVTGIPKSDCPALMATVLSAAQSSGLYYVETDYGGSAYVTATSPVLTDNAVINCKGNIVFQFAL